MSPSETPNPSSKEYAEKGELLSVCNLYLSVSPNAGIQLAYLP